MGTTKKPPENPSAARSTSTDAKRQAVERKSEAEHAHADRAQRNQAVLDLAAGEIPAAKLPKPIPMAMAACKIAAVRLVEMQNFRAVEHDRELEQRAEKPEIGVAEQPRGATRDRGG